MVACAVRFPPEVMQRLRKGVMKRGQFLATLLEQVLAGKQPPQLTLLPGKPGMRPEEKLRMALDQVEGRRKLIDADDDAYGRCGVCGEDLGLPALDEMPWADRCAAHAAT
jgi:hypothetical protein